MVKILVGSQFREISLMVVDDIDIPLVLGQDFLEKHQVDKESYGMAKSRFILYLSGND